MTRKRGLPVDHAIFTCISMLAKAVGPAISKDIRTILEPMLAAGLRSVGHDIMIKYSWGGSVVILVITIPY